MRDLWVILDILEKSKEITSPRCSECNEMAEVIYHDELDGDDYCPSCLEESINRYPDTLKDLEKEGAFK